MRKKCLAPPFLVFIISIKSFLTPYVHIVHESVFIVRDLGATQFVFRVKKFLVNLFFS